ncbi:hypothetical protein Lalb_Chr15g0081301 [Lupinus albus]|uniref:Uncharacterized protein n=1 Tax=Lupinus albus TaxID=3870 RepID=A0A6A4PEC4_LUPAL|nr:hypothetical protein Lalb_Chr15g0081301 [Lupinus albus]
MNPRTFPDLTPKLHLLGFNLSWYLRTLSKSFCKLATCSPSVLDLQIISST